MLDLLPELELLAPRTEQIRRATPGDLPAIAELIDASMRGLSTGYSRRQIESALLFLAQVDPRMVTDGTYYVAESGEQLVGAGGWTRRPTRHGVVRHEHAASYEAWLDQNRDAASIRSVYVHPAWARRGIGRRLLEMSERAAHRAGYRELALLASLPGVPLYEACGYTGAGRLELVLPDRTIVPAVPMRKHSMPIPSSMNIRD